MNERPDQAPAAGADRLAEGAHPHIRSFSGRRGHFTPGQKQAYETLFDRWALPYRREPIVPAKVFGRAKFRAPKKGYGLVSVPLNVSRK